MKNKSASKPRQFQQSPWGQTPFDEPSIMIAGTSENDITRISRSTPLAPARQTSAPGHVGPDDLRNSVARARYPFASRMPVVSSGIIVSPSSYYPRTQSSKEEMRKTKATESFMHDGPPRHVIGRIERGRAGGDVKAGTIPERVWKKLYVQNRTPQKAADPCCEASFLSGVENADREPRSLSRRAPRTCVLHYQQCG
jgi:hypothetical protein